MLRRIKGIGPWTAAVILLRGLGRLDVFPANDSGVAASISLVAGSARPDLEAVLNALGSQRGMLYFHLLLARLEASGEVSNASHPTASPLGGFTIRRALHGCDILAMAKLSRKFEGTARRRCAPLPSVSIVSIPSQHCFHAQRPPCCNT
jgi:3-methyladenine DNA glycosylase/8-oxoguanine DNA glycosylase